MLEEGIQAVFAAFTGGNVNASSLNATEAVSQAFKPGALDISSILTLLLSFGALRDWAKLVLLGGIIETTRRFLTYAYDSIKQSFVLNVDIDGDDAAYAWMLLWLSKQEPWKKARTIELSSSMHSGHHRRGYDDPPRDDKGVTMAPTTGTTHTLWYKGRFMRVSRKRENLGDGVIERTLSLVIYTRSHALVNQLIDEAKLLHDAEIDSRVNIFVTDQYSNWFLSGSRPKRDMNSVVIPPRIKEFLISDCRDFLASELWYSERGIPWQRGWLLHGVPGAGKTSIIQALAGVLGINIYVISIGRRGLDDSLLIEMINCVPARSIILMEDIDAAFSSRISRETPVPSTPSSPDSSQPVSSVTLSGLLNALDGVQAQPGRLIFATTNKYDALDPALIRPGRLDVHLEFKRASRWQAEQLFRKFYPATGNYIDTAEGDDDEHDGALDSDADIDDPFDDYNYDPSSDTSSTPTRVTTPTPSPASVEKPFGSGIDIPILAKAFATSIPRGEISMAALQGHLMHYKRRPGSAVRRAEAFVKRELERIAKAAAAATATQSSSSVTAADTAAATATAPASAEVPSVGTDAVAHAALPAVVEPEKQDNTAISDAPVPITSPEPSKSLFSLPGKISRA